MKMKMVQQQQQQQQQQEESMMVQWNSNSVCNCKHSPSATLDLLILLIVLFSGAFLLSSYLCYIFNALSLLLPSLSLSLSLPILLLLLLLCVLSLALRCAARSRRCQRSGCKGLKKAMEFDLQIHRFASPHEFDKLPWKGGTQANPDYDCLRQELRKMAPPNGRALLLFRAPCGCPIAKLEASGPRKPKRHKRVPFLLAKFSSLSLALSVIAFTLDSGYAL
ncbi:hypothetical protein Fmac_009174 [Flemingia macrophylla]|uniref:Ribosomal protein L34e superfamily protein n=1 Tax=Flemingia macrophylla TaxID=520843 RepID=A0ABD1MZK4_9FABA